MANGALDGGFVDQIVVRVKKQDQLAAGQGEALVHGIGDALIGLRYPFGNLFGVLLDNPEGAVRGGAVDDDVFDLRIALRDHAPDCLLEVSLGIAADGDHRDRRRAFRCFGHGRSYRSRR